MPGRPMLAIASPAVIRLAVCIHSLAWVAVFLTIAAVWRVIQITRRGIESPWGIFQRSFLALTLLVLAAFCLYFRIAGTSLEF